MWIFLEFLSKKEDYNFLFRGKKFYNFEEMKVHSAKVSYDFKKQFPDKEYCSIYYRID